MARPGTEQLVPGWYPDPARGDDTYRWWTGVAWTDLLTRDPASPPPPVEQPGRTVTPAPRASRRGLVAVVGSALLVIVFLVAATTVGSARGPGQPVLPRTPIPTSPAPVAAAPWAIGAGGVLSLGSQATARFPGAPYGDAGRPGPIYGLLEQGAVVDATTAPARGSTPAWAASVISGWIDPDLASSTPRLVAENVFRVLPQVLFSSASTTSVSAVTVAALPGFAETEAIRATATLSYDVPGLAATHDSVVLIIVGTDPVNYALWMSSVPDDASVTITAATAAAEMTVVRR